MFLRCFSEPDLSEAVLTNLFLANHVVAMLTLANRVLESVVLANPVYANVLFTMIVYTDVVRATFVSTFGSVTYLMRHNVLTTFGLAIFVLSSFGLVNLD